MQLADLIALSQMLRPMPGPQLPAIAKSPSNVTATSIGSAALNAPQMSSPSQMLAALVGAAGTPSEIALRQAQTGTAGALTDALRASSQPMPDDVRAELQGLLGGDRMAPIGSSGLVPMSIGGALGGGTPSAGGPIDFAKARALAQKVGFQGPAADTMAATAMAESGGDPNAIGGREKGGSFGLTQINARAHGPVARTALGNAEQAMRLAYEVSKGGTDFSPWTMFNNGGYQKFLPASGGDQAPPRPVQLAQAGPIAPGLLGGGSPTAPVAGDTLTDLQRKDRLRQQDPYLGLGPSGLGGLIAASAAPPAGGAPVPVTLPARTDYVPTWQKGAVSPSPPYQPQGGAGPQGLSSGFSPRTMQWLQQQDARNSLLGKRNPVLVDEALKLPFIGANEAAKRSAGLPYLQQEEIIKANEALRQNLAQQGLALGPNGTIVKIPGFREENAANKGAEAAAQAQGKLPSDLLTQEQKADLDRRNEQAKQRFAVDPNAFGGPQPTPSGSSAPLTTQRGTVIPPITEASPVVGSPDQLKEMQTGKGGWTDVENEWGKAVRSNAADENSVRTLGKVFQTFGSGAFQGALADAQANLRTLGIDLPLSDDPAKAQIAAKLAFQRMIGSMRGVDSNPTGWQLKAMVGCRRGSW